MGEGAVTMRDDKVPLLSTQLTPSAGGQAVQAPKKPKYAPSRWNISSSQTCTPSEELRLQYEWHAQCLKCAGLIHQQSTYARYSPTPSVHRSHCPKRLYSKVTCNVPRYPSIKLWVQLRTPCSYVMRTRSRAKVTKPVRSSTSRRQFLLAQETWEDLVAIDSLDTDAGGRLRVYIKTIDTGEISAHDAAVTYAKCPQKVCVHAMSGTINSSADTRRCFASTRSTFASYNWIPPTQMHGIGGGHNRYHYRYLS